jgi:3-oxoacyl-[acyl-carrier protein] reductase
MVKPHMSSLGGKRALVTGAASGIGRAIAAGLAEAGASVVGIDLKPAEDAASPIEIADIADDKAASAAVARVAGRLGGLDIVCNAAGVMPEASLADIDRVHVDLLFGVNVRGTIMVTKAALPHLGDGARIINIASELAYLGRAGFSVYCATKGAILSLTRSWARELAPKILVNAVAPGPTDTPLLAFDQLRPELQALETANPLRRIARPEEVAAAVVYLAGPGATYITGQCLTVDGGSAMH